MCTHQYIIYPFTWLTYWMKCRTYFFLWVFSLREHEEASFETNALNKMEMFYSCRWRLAAGGGGMFSGGKASWDGFQSGPALMYMWKHYRYYKVCICRDSASFNARFLRLWSTLGTFIPDKCDHQTETLHKNLDQCRTRFCWNVRRVNS